MRAWSVLAALALADVLTVGTASVGRLESQKLWLRSPTQVRWSHQASFLHRADNHGQPWDQPAKSVDWFSRDANQMAQMPTYLDDRAIGPPGDPFCDPRCQYHCGPKECDEVCEAACVPPQCETVCAKSADKCENRCGPPRCAVICPNSDCADGICPKCRTLCSPPLCTTQCSDSCQSVCTPPTCSWKCHPGKCPRPACKLECTGIKRCRQPFPPASESREQILMIPGRDVASEGVASLNPASLADAANPMTTTFPEHNVMPTHVPVSSQNAWEPLEIGPVRALKMKWMADDQRREEKQMLRRLR